MKHQNIIAKWLNDTFTPQKSEQPRNRVGQWVKVKPQVIFYSDLRAICNK